MGLPKLSIVDSTGTDRREGYFYLIDTGFVIYRKMSYLCGLNDKPIRI